MPFLKHQLIRRRKEYSEKKFSPVKVVVAVIVIIVKRKKANIFFLSPWYSYIFHAYLLKILIGSL